MSELPPDIAKMAPQGIPLIGQPTPVRPVLFATCEEHGEHSELMLFHFDDGEGNQEITSAFCMKCIERELGKFLSNLVQSATVKFMKPDGTVVDEKEVHQNG